jgi:uncharacterized membrane protein YhaH (DUF805 family)
MRWVLAPFLRYADFKGRSGRAEFWTFFGVSVGMIVFVVLLTGLSTTTGSAEKLAPPSPPGANASPIGAIIYVVWWFASIVPWVAVQVRRLHDQGRSGWLALVGISGYIAAGFGVIPLAGILVIAWLALMALKGEATENRFGLPIDVAEDDDAAPTELNSSPANVQLDVGEPHADQDNNLPEIKQIVEYTERPVSEDSKDKRQAIEPEEVQRFGNGQFSVGGHVFSTIDEAEWYNQRRAVALASVGSSTSVLRATPDGRPVAWNELEAGIHFGRDGKFYVQGKSYWTIEDAREAKHGVPAETDHPGERENRPPTGDNEGSREGVAIGSSNAIPSNLPPYVKSEGNGRFSCGGYTFNSLEKALNFAKRRSDRSGNLERSVSPLSLVPPASPPQHPTLKAERSGFVGFGSSAMKQNIAERWIGSPTPLSAGGVTFEGYLLYFGTLPKQRHYERHSSLVDPNLAVSNGRDPDGSTFSYWPNYSELRPEARHSYLEWLADGRRNPDTPIGYVFIYFYGLERRLVKDRSEADAPAIMDELRRLLAIYGNNSSFRGYCTRLIEMGELLFGEADQPPMPTLDNRYHWELPVGLRIYLGKKVAAGQNLDANDALCWMLGHPQLYPRTPVTRCFAEFCELWQIRFEEQFPKGLSVREPKTRLNIQFSPASSEFNATITADNLPDVGAINGPISKFEQMFGSCSDELDPLSRFLGRYPAENNSIIAGALLPEPLRRDGENTAFGRFCQSLQANTSEAGFAEVTVGELISRMGLPATGAKDDRRALHLKRLPELLDAADFGFEPDKRFGASPSISEDLTICIFPAKGGGAVNANRPEYQAARTMAEIAALAARSDDLVVEAEVQSIATDLVSFDFISDLDRTRLRAHASALLANPSKVKAATKRLTELPEAERQAALTSAVRAVLADQRISPAEVRFLEGLYKALGLPQDEVYSRLHSGDVVSPKPKTKAADKTGAVSGSADTGAVINEAKLARLQQETSAVSTMLASIFKEEETASKVPEVAPETVSAAISGLDLAHSKVLSRLADAPMEADTFGELCRELKLLPSGAIETINDWAFDALDDYAIEEGERISIQEHLIEPIKAMRSAE